MNTYGMPTATTYIESRPGTPGTWYAPVLHAPAVTPHVHVNCHSHGDEWYLADCETVDAMRCTYVFRPWHSLESQLDMDKAHSAAIPLVDLDHVTMTWHRVPRCQYTRTFGQAMLEDEPKCSQRSGM